MDNQVTDLIAKLLATEDLTVVHDTVETASFNIEARVLTLPIWKDTSNDLTSMLVGHEVGHALYTGMEYIEHSTSPAFQTYLNVLEDVRIEKLMKRKYPGIRKCFMAGYKELQEKDFFGVANKDLTDLLLIDKINLYFKAGYNCGVTFTKQEKDYVERAEKTETIEDVIQLAKDLFEFTKEQIQNQQQQVQISIQLDPDDDDGDARNGTQMEMEQGQSNSNEDLASKQNSMGAGKGNDDEKLASKTDRAFTKKMSELSNIDVKYKYWKLGKFLYDPVIPYSQVRNKFKYSIDQGLKYNNIDEEYCQSKKTEVDSFKAASAPVVNYLIKEFEMKKAASSYKRTTISKSGQLDMRKVYAYTLKDDIFKRIANVKQGKNHGMIMLLDWSGSMSHVIKPTLEQVINLAMFCRRAQIPFEVMAFTDSYTAGNNSFNNLDKQKVIRQPDDMLEVNTNSMSLLQLFNSKQTNQEFNESINYFRGYKDMAFSMGGTPLNEALIYMVDYIGEFKRKNNVEKMTFITLTDGMGDGLRGTNDTWIETRTFDNKLGKYLDVKNFVKDEHSKKSYNIDDNSSNLTNALLNIIKDRYSATILGFYLTNTGYSSLYNVLRSHYDDYHSISDSVILRMKEQFKKEGYASLKGTGRDDLFVVPIQSTKIENGSISDIKGDGTPAAIARQFGKIFNRRKTSRILLNKFIDYIA